MVGCMASRIRARLVNWAVDYSQPARESRRLMSQSIAAMIGSYSKEGGMANKRPTVAAVKSGRGVAIFVAQSPFMA